MSNQSVAFWNPSSVTDAWVSDWDNLKTIAISANTHNYNDVDFGTIDGWRIDVINSRDLTGIVNTLGGTRSKIIFNNTVGGTTKTLTLRHENGSSAAANRFHLPDEKSLDILAGEGVVIIYDTTRSRWVVVETQANPPSTSFLEYAYIEHTTQADLNNAPVQWRPVQLNAGTFSTNIAGVTATATAIIDLPDGDYYISAQSRLAGNSSRTNLLYRISPNGLTTVGPVGASGYIRSVSGHNVSSDHVSGIFNLAGGNNTVGVIGMREASGGPVTTTGASGILSIMRIA